MADKLTVDQVHDLLDVLRADAPIDTKVQLVTAAKSSIKQHNVPDNAVPVLFEALRTASVSQHAALVNAGFTSLNHLLTRLSRQEPKLLAKEAARTLPVIVDKLGDLKEKYRTLAQQGLVTLYRVAPMDVERSVRNTAMSGKNPRAKESAMQWLLQMHQEQGLPFRGYVPGLMDLLEDADGMVRDAAKLTVIELFRNAPNAAKTDLKKQLKNFKVRPAIEQAIVKELAPTSALSSAPATGADADPYPRPPSSRTVRPTPSATTSSFAASVSSLSAGERPVTPSPDSVGRAESVEPLYVNTQREIDDMFREMPVWFEGKETEQNWLKREQSVTRLRRLVAGNGLDFQDAFLAGVRALLDGIIKAMTSLRTSLCKEGCSLIQDLAHACGPAIDPMVEILLQTLIKLSAGTKKISSQLANNTVDAIVAKATYNTRILQHIWGACQDKNVQPRTYATGWLKTVLHREAHHKERIEHSGGLDLVEKCIKKGLIDPNPGVRERMRATYWVFAGIWPARAETIMAGLDGTAQRLLQNDANNPNSPKRAGGSAAPSAPTAARPASGLSKSTMGSSTSSKPSLRETMLAKKREKEALAARNLPVRPGSAMAHFSPVRTASNASSSSNASSTTTGTLFGRQRADGEGGGGGGAFGGLSVAPVRPTKRRPELHARPATAGPYSVRSHDHASMEQSSPPDSFRTAKSGTASKPLAATPKRTVPRGRPGHQATASDSHLVTPSRVTGAAAANGASKAAASRPAAAGTTSASSRGSPPKPRPGVRAGAARAGGEHPQAPQHSQLRQQQQERQEQERQEQERQEQERQEQERQEQERQEQEQQEEERQEQEERQQEQQQRATTPTTPLPMQPVRGRGVAAVAVVDVDDDDSNVVGGRIVSPPLKVYEDPSDGEEAAAATTPTAPAALFAPTALEDRPVNEDAGRLLAHGSGEAARAGGAAVVVVDGVVAPGGGGTPMLYATGGSGVGAPPEKAKQNARLLDSGIAKVQAQALDVHGFRKLQGIIRDAGSEEALTATTATTATGPQLFTDERFDALLLGLFAYLESRVTSVAPEKVPDVKAQILATIKLLLKKWRGRFQPHVSRGLEALLAARAGYDARTHMVAGLELLADELVLLGDAAEIAVVLTGALDRGGAPPSNGSGSGSGPAAAASPHALSMGLHVLKELVEARPAFQPTETELGRLAGLAQRCLESSESGVRMDAVQLCVALHERVGDGRFWDVLRGVQDDPKSLITYYIVKRQREGGAAAR